MSDNTIALIVDDSEINRYLLRRQLQLIGVEQVLEEDDGATALALLEDCLKTDRKANFPPSVIFLDLNMPNLDGFEFLEQYSECVRQNMCPVCNVLVYSSSDRLDDKKKACQHDCVKAFLVKGDTTLEQLKQVLSSLHH